MDATTAEIKHMWIDPAARGRGLGRDLLTALEHWAARLGVGPELEAALSGKLKPKQT